MQTLSEYASSKRSDKKIPADIVSRWRERIEKRGLHKMEAAGARQYLADYGKSIAAPKCINLARMAEAEGYPGMALGFWRKAYILENKAEPPDAAPGTPVTAAPMSTTSQNTLPKVADLPAHLQPGRISTMQPVDTDLDRTLFVESPEYIGQPKRDGKRMVVIADGQGQVYYQSRSMALWEAPDQVMHERLCAAAQTLGTFVLDGELVYFDATGGEHRTGSQAAQANINMGRPDVMPQVCYCTFKALYRNGIDLTDRPEEARINAGEQIGFWLASREPNLFETVPTAYTYDQKQDLCKRQLMLGCEGEVWVRRDCTYQGGKSSLKVNPLIVRTKYPKFYNVLVVGLTPTTAEDRLFGAIEVKAYVDGKLVNVGTVGTGFDQAQMAEIERQFVRQVHDMVIEVRAYDLTENNKLWLPSYVGIRDDVRPEDCVL